MAKYQREFLVPHLRDIYALQLALHKLQEQMDELEHQKRSLERGTHLGIHPVRPCYEASNGAFSLCLGAFLFMLALWMFLDRLPVFGLFFALVSFMALIVGAIRYVKVTQENMQKETRYQQKLEHYHAAQKTNDRRRKDIPRITEKMDECEAEIQRIRQTLQKVYETGIIPEQYQNLPTARFLHVWFGTGKPNDLDTALQVFSLLGDQSQINGGVSSPSEDILAQYLQGAAQGQSPDADRMKRLLNRIFVSDEERDLYQAIIDNNLSTTACFAAAKHLSQG